MSEISYSDDSAEEYKCNHGGSRFDKSGRQVRQGRSFLVRWKSILKLSKWGTIIQTNSKNHLFITCDLTLVLFILVNVWRLGCQKGNNKQTRELDSISSQGKNQSELFTNTGLHCSDTLYCMYWLCKTRANYMTSKWCPLWNITNKTNWCSMPLHLIKVGGNGVH